MSLEFVTPPQQTTVNVLLYGGPKVGKTLGAASSPGPTLYINADLPNATRKAHEKYPTSIFEVRFEGMQTLIDATHEVEAGKWTTVVLDTAGEAYRVLLEEFSGRAVRPSLPLYGDTSTHIERFCRRMCELPVNFVVVCHEIDDKDESSGVIEKMPFTGTSKTKLGTKLMGMVDIVGYCGVSEVEGEGAQYLAQLLPVNGRRGGDRFDVLGKVRSTDLSEWIEAINKPEGTTNAG